MVKGCHTGFNVFFTTSVLWQIVNLEEKEEEEEERRNEEKIHSKRGKYNYLLIIQAQERDTVNMEIRGGASH